MATQAMPLDEPAEDAAPPMRGFYLARSDSLDSSIGGFSDTGSYSDASFFDGAEARSTRSAGTPPHDIGDLANVNAAVAASVREVLCFQGPAVKKPLLAYDEHRDLLWVTGKRATELSAYANGAFVASVSLSQSLSKCTVRCIDCTAGVLFVGTDDGHVAGWDGPDVLTLLIQLSRRKKRVDAIAARPPGLGFVCAQSSVLTIHSGRETLQEIHLNSPVESLASAHQSHPIWIGTSTGSVYFHLPDAESAVKCVTAHRLRVWAMVASPDGTRAWSGNGALNSRIVEWRVGSTTPMSVIEKPHSEIRCLALWQDGTLWSGGQTLMAGGGDSVKAWRGARCVKSFVREGARGWNHCHSVAVSRNKVFAGLWHDTGSFGRVGPSMIKVYEAGEQVL
eukprot:TRINITY_DN2123_c0_g1_i1.p1 TRINITY_DN2123_c0_g1~~TRINITY_DN2123_c0_g1_i1.p1  ORF type:complete len:393 (+),score=8.77 TRINITY_DN2123_c0_g1_i1:436-1614(+)